MISRMIFCASQASTTRCLRLGPMPSRSVRRSGVCSMTSNTCSPKAWTSFLAKCGPMPLTIPEPRYFSIPSNVLGGTTRRACVLNCRPCVRSFTQTPCPSMYSPGVMVAAVPTTVTRSRCPRTLTRRTQKPVSSLWNVTRSTAPVSCSVGCVGGEGDVGVKVAIDSSRAY